MSETAFRDARHIEIDERQGLVIDGRLFPYPVSVDYIVHHGPHDTPGVTVRLFCNVVTVNGRWRTGRIPQAPTLAKRWHDGPFQPLDIAAERARLADLGQRIAATRASTLPGAVNR